jgi:hypothetical protein
MEAVVTEEIIARQPPEAQAIIRLLLARIAALEARVEELERQVKGKTPQNSSLPPSTQHPHAKPAPRKPKSKRKRGGQPGHKKHERPLIPTNATALRHSNRAHAAAVARSSRARILNHCGIRCGKCRRSSRT